VAGPFLFLIERHPRFLAAGLVALTLLAFVGAGQLKFNDVPKDLFGSSGEDFRILAQVEKQFSTDENACLIVVQSKQHLFNPQALRGFKQLVEQVSAVEGIETVISMASVPVFDGGLLPKPMLPATDASAEQRTKALDVALNHPLVGDVLLSKDGRTSLVIVHLAGKQMTVESIQKVLLKVRAQTDQASKSGGFTCYLTGVPEIRVAVLTTMKRDQVVLTFAGIFVGGFVSFLMFRTISATVLVAAGPFLGLIWTVGVLGFLGIEINPISSVLPTLILVIGFTDSVHLGLDMRRQRALGVDRREAALHTVRRLALPCGLTSLTTAVGFASLCIADIPSIRNLGLVTAIGAVMTFFAVLSVVPFLGTTFLGKRLARRGMAVHEDGTSRWAKLANPIVRFPRAIAIAGILATLALGWVASHLRPDTKLTDTVPRNFESFEGLRVSERAFGGAIEAQILIEWDDSPQIDSAAMLGAIDAAKNIVAQSKDFGRPLSILDLLAAAPGNQAPVQRAMMLPLLPKEASRRFLRADLRRALIRVRVPDRYASKLRPQFEMIESKLAGLKASHPGFRFWVTGPVVVIGKNIRDMITELIKTLGVAAVIIFIILTISFRSVRLGLISLVPNTFPMVMTGAAIVAIGSPLVIGNVIVFSVCLGIAVDDTIHFIAAYRRSLAQGRSPTDAVTRSFVTVGSALVTTTVVLIMGFATTTLSGLNIVWMFGALSCVAIASALIGDLFILPSLLLWFGGQKGNADGTDDADGPQAEDQTPKQDPNAGDAGSGKSAVQASPKGA
jgi:predicted RND superfamily exporter protein